MVLERGQAKMETDDCLTQTGQRKKKGGVKRCVSPSFFFFFGEYNVTSTNAEIKRTYLDELDRNMTQKGIRVI